MIDWSGAIFAGVAGGLATELSAALLRLLGFGRHSMVSYEGCMLIKELNGMKRLAAALRHSALLFEPADVTVGDERVASRSAGCVAKIIFKRGSASNVFRYAATPNSEATNFA
jgi:hypothetical protein